MTGKSRIMVVGVSMLVLLLTVMCAFPTQQVIVVTATQKMQSSASIASSQEIASSDTTVTVDVEEELPTSQPPTEGAPPPTPTTRATKPLATPLPPQAQCNAAEAAWVGSFGYGLNCIDSAGWHTYLPDTSGLSGDQIKDIAVCADNQAWIVSGLGLDSTDGATWQSYKEELDYSSAEAVACDPKNGVWVAHYKGVHHFDGSTWTAYEANLLGTGKYVDMVKDVTVAPDGTVWFVTTNSVAKFDGTDWTVFETGSGFSKDYYFTAIAVDPQGMVWAAHGSGIWKYDGSNWTNQEGRDFSQVGCLTIDKNGYLWAGTYSKGLNLYNGQGWINYNRQNSGLSSNHVRSLAVDGDNRIWVGTEWGLDVFDGQEWQTYHMHDSALTDNEIYAVAVGGVGPPLPEWIDKGTGSLTGRIVDGEEGVSNARVEVCTEFIGMIFSGSTPCSDNPLRQETTTGADGSFTFAELPVGRYSIAFQPPDGQWMYLTGSFGVGNKSVEVESGKETNLDVIDISEEDE